MKMYGLYHWKLAVLVVEIHAVAFLFFFFNSVLVNYCNYCSMTSSPKLSGLGNVYYLIVSVLRDSGPACVSPLL